SGRPRRYGRYFLYGISSGSGVIFMYRTDCRNDFGWSSVKRRLSTAYRNVWFFTGIGFAFYAICNVSGLAQHFAAFGWLDEYCESIVRISGISSGIQIFIQCRFGIAKTLAGKRSVFSYLDCCIRYMGIVFARENTAATR